MKKRFFVLSLMLLTHHAFAEGGVWYTDKNSTRNDPLQTNLFSLPQLADEYQGSPCDGLMSGERLEKPLTLAEVADASLCNNPQTREVWASARVQAAQLGIAKSAYLPSLTDNISVNNSVLNPASTTRSNPNLNLSNSLVASYLLYDFGNRNANLENARQ